MVSLCRLRRGRGASKVSVAPESTGTAVIGGDMYGWDCYFRQGDSCLGMTRACPTYSHHQLSKQAAWPQGWPEPSCRVQSRAPSMRKRRP